MKRNKINWYQTTFLTVFIVFATIILIISANPILLGGDKVNHPYANFGSEFFDFISTFLTLSWYWQGIAIILFLASTALLPFIFPTSKDRHTRI